MIVIFWVYFRKGQIDIVNHWKSDSYIQNLISSKSFLEQHFKIMSKKGKFK